MTAQEWLELVELLLARWPNADLTEETITQWGTDLQFYPASEVRAVIDEHYFAGDAWPPHGGQLIAAMSRGQRAELDHGKAWELANQVNRRFGLHREHQPQAALAALEHAGYPEVAEALRRFGLDEFAMRDLDNAGTDRAQFRDIFNAVARERTDDRAAGRIAGARRAELRPAGETFKQIAAGDQGGS